MMYSPLLAKNPAWVILVPIVILAFVIYELYVGVAHFGRFVRVEREESPVVFWLIIIAKLILIVILFAASGN